MYLKVLKRKAAKKLLKSSWTIIDFLYLIIVYNEGNIDKKFQPCIFCRSRKKLFVKSKGG